MRLLALIPARGGSKGIPRKNIKPLAGKPLLGWTIDVARQAGSIDRIVVSTEDEEIAALARDLGAEVPFMRPAALSADDTPGIEPVIHALEQLPEVDWVLLLQPTSPLRAAEDIEGIVQLCLEREAPSAVSVTAVDKHPYWMYQRDEKDRLEPMIPDQPAITTRQELPPTYVLNGALYLARRDWLLEQRRFVGPDTLGYVMPPERSVDLDTPRDWDWVEFLIERENAK
ncbi:cytidylyltransferase domain-containing protein [Ectothiorhodospira marina]|uniref:N-acylneuraminate cytidylyltransferase n=1 Tax=Ectothiorhodospira marina TaxID=1396821 RepID=A0A1H7I9X3_9GAMM|nr:acylneuraminate cytidylyltransferase family protein [Ectothiorhodospira marina]SEK59296.1 N-acylneuraminate cytidylyltransferase [Ectothiorhodospira marina]